MAGSWSIPGRGDSPKLGDSTAPRVNAVGRTGWLRFPVLPARQAVFWEDWWVVGCRAARNWSPALVNLPRCRQLHSLAPFRNWQVLGLPLKKTDLHEG